MKTVPLATSDAPRLLIVDDDPASVRLLARIVHGLGTINFASSGEEALRLVNEIGPDLLLLDAEMPGMGGFAALTALKADPGHLDLPVIFVTAHASTEEETQALTLGAVDFIHKPINPAVVLARVKTHLELKRRGDALRRLTTVDSLTGLANRRAFDERLSSEWRRAMRTRDSLSLLMLDVDYFKRFNDTYGHPAGDACLRLVAQALLPFAQRGGDLAARYGGEEFALILPHTPPTNAQAIAEHLLAAVTVLKIPHANSPVASWITASIGVASVVVPCVDSEPVLTNSQQCHAFSSCSGPESLITFADQALYEAKRTGRACIACVAGPPDPVHYETLPV